MNVNNYSNSIASVNICGITSDLKKFMLRDFIVTQCLDIVLLQEVSFRNFDFMTNYQVILNVGQNLRGTAILIRNNMKYSNVRLLSSSRGISLDVNGFKIVNIYAPSGSQAYREREVFFAQEFPLLLDNQDIHLLVGGDFNCITELSQTSNKSYNNRCQILKDYISAKSLADVWPLKNSDCGYTYFQGCTGNRLDRFYVSSDAAQSVLSARLCVSAFTDHRAIVIGLHMTDTFAYFRRFGSWKLNTSILNDRDLNDLFKINWLNWAKSKHRYSSRLLWWNDYVKPRIQSFLKWQSSTIRKKNRAKMEFFNLCLREIMERPPSTENYVEIKKFRALIVENQRQLLNGYKIRSKDSKVIHNEHTSLYHIIKEAKNFRKKNICEIQVQGEVYREENEVIRKVEEYFLRLYSDEAHRSQNIMPNNLGEKKLSSPSNDILNTDITIDELEDIIKNHTKNKSPGPDGLPAEFYSHFWNLIRDDLLIIMNEINRCTPVPESFKLGMIVLVPKTSKPVELADYRPISLLNEDYKIYMKCVKNRLSQVMGDVIGREQTCCVNNDNIISGLIRIREVIARSKLANDNSMLISVDLDHAFDRVRHDYLWELLDTYNFNNQFVSKLKNIYTDAYSFINVNLNTTRKIKLNKSIRQGCPLSMLLFILAIEPLINDLKKQHIWTSAYADDVTVKVEYNQITKVGDILRNYCQLSGAVLNVNKCEAICLGSRSRQGDVLQDSWFSIKSEVKILGIVCTSNFHEMIRINWLRVTGNAQLILATNKIRNLSLYQKATFINTYVLSRVWYISHILPIPVMVSKRLKCICGTFLWRTPLRVSWNRVIAPKRHGGLCVTDPWMKANTLLIVAVFRFVNRFPGELMYINMSDICNPPFERAIPYSFPHMRRIVVEAAYLEHDVLAALTVMNSKTLYSHFQRSHELSFKINYLPQVYRNINNKILSHVQKSILYVIVGNVFPTQVNLSKIGVVNSPVCVKCNLYYESLIHKLQCDRELKISLQYMCSLLNMVTGKNWQINEYLTFNFDFHRNKNKFIVLLLALYLEYLCCEKFEVRHIEMCAYIQSKRDLLQQTNAASYNIIKDYL